MLLRQSLLLLSLLVGCAASPSPAVAVPTPAAVHAAPAAGPVHVVWTRPASGQEQTHFLIPGPTGPRELARIPGIHVAVDGQLWRWQTEPASVPLYSCEDPELAVGTGEGVRASFVRVSDGATFEVASPPTWEGMAELDHHVSLLASAGPYVFVTSSTYDYSCGAHGNVSATFATWDLRTMERVSLLDTDELRAVDDGERREAHSLLSAKGNDVGEEVRMEDVELVAAAPSFGPEGLALSYLFTAPACYACGDGLWDSYTIGAEVSARELPHKVRAFARLPEDVRAFTASHTGRLGGISELVDLAALPTGAPG